MTMTTTVDRSAAGPVSCYPDYGACVARDRSVSCVLVRVAPFELAVVAVAKSLATARPLSPGTIFPKWPETIGSQPPEPGQIILFIRQHCRAIAACLICGFRVVPLHRLALLGV